jgi:hypothetical protein
MKTTRQLLILLVVVGLAGFSLTALVGAGCGAGDTMSKAAAEGDNGWGSWDEEPGAAMDASSSADYGAPPAPEEEFDFDLKAPQASEHYVYIAATNRDSLVRINADESLEIRLIAVGGKPTTVATLASQDVALVINSGTHDFSIVRSTQETDTVKTLDLLPYVNTIAVSPDGKYAIVYYNDAVAEPADPVGDFQTVAVVNVQEGKEQVFQVSTGFHVTSVTFHESDPMAYLVTDDGVSILDLADVKDGDITPIVAVSENPLEDPEMREVLVSQAGDFAVVRNLAIPQLTVVDLETGALSYVEVAGLPTDVDLIPGTGRFLAVLREQGLAYVADLAGALEGAEDSVATIDISGSLAGAAVVTADGTRAVLYTTVGGVKAIALLELDEEGFPWKSFPVQKGVVGVSVSNDGGTAIVFHQAEGYAADASPLEKTIAMSHGFTLFSLDSGYRKLIQTDHKWTEHLFVSESDGTDLKAYVLTPDPQYVGHAVQEADLGTYIVDPLAIASTPVSMVFVPTSRKVAVAQDHMNGRITFIDVDTGETYSVTGYELNGLIH